MLKTVGNPSTRYGDQTIIDGNLIIGTNGKGIDFSATPGTGTSELFDDYEEGIWTPEFGFFSALSGSFTYTSQVGYYTKIGRLVTATFEIAWSAKPAAGNTLYVTLPMTSSRAGSIRGPATSASNITLTGENLGAGFTQISMENAGPSYPGLSIPVMIRSGAAFSDTIGNASLGASGSLNGTIIFEA